MRTLALILIFTGLLSHICIGQKSPAVSQSQAILISGGTVHLGDGRVIENAVITFENGKITAVAEAATFTEDRNRYRIIDAGGKHIYPAFISLDSQLGLKEISMIRATRDYNETGSFNPNLRSLIAYNTDSEVTPTIRSRGVLLAQICPTGGYISGMSSVVQLDAWNWEDASFHADEGIHLNWPRLYRNVRWWSTETDMKNKEYEEQVFEIRGFFNEAKSYAARKVHSKINLKFEAMRPVFESKRNLYIRTNNARTMMEAVLFAKEYGINPVIVGGQDSWMITDFLKQHNVPVILNQTHSLPGSADEDIDQPFKTPAMLQQAGILFAISMNGSWEQRNLPFQAGQAVGFGLPYENAVSSMSLNCAKILGIDDRVGTLEKGKDATFFICTGDVLDMRSSSVEQAFIQGRDIDLDNKQDELYRKYKEKFEQQN